MGRIGKYLKDNTVFVVSVLIAVTILILGYIYAAELGNISSVIMYFVSDKFGWLYLMFVMALCFFLGWLAFGRYGGIKLGNPDDVPEYSNFSWFAMLFCGGTGIGLVFWSIAEPLSHYAAPPSHIAAATPAAADFSIRNCFLHWGITQWACFAIVGLGIAYFQFRKKQNGMISSLLTPLVGKKAARGTFGKIIDIFAILVSYAGVATSLGLGVTQICGGLNYLWDVPNTPNVWLLIIVVIMLIFMASALSGVNNGIKALSGINTYLALTLLTLGFLLGPKTAMFNTLVNGLGQHIQYFFADVLMVSPLGDNTWVMNWRVFYFAWFIAWTPFVGMFVAAISKGRTIRQFIIGVVLIPTVFTIIWLSVFGTIALATAGTWSLDALLTLIASPETAVFIVFEQYPLSKVVSVLIMLLLAIFFVTSADSATYSLSMMSSNGDLKPPQYKKIVWAILEAAIAYLLLSANSLKALQTVSIAASLPFLFIMIAMCPALVIELRKETEVDECKEKQTCQNQLT